MFMKVCDKFNVQATWVCVRHYSQKQNETKIKILMDTVYHQAAGISMQYESTLSGILRP
jgi:hypothetical protein